MMATMQPLLILGFVFCLGHAALFHLCIGRQLRDLLIGLFMATIGFIFGQTIGIFVQLPFLQIGQLHLFEASVGAWLSMSVAKLVAP